MNHVSEVLATLPPAGVCMYCGWTYRQGGGPISHGVCTDPNCLALHGEFLTLDLMNRMHTAAAKAYGTYIAAKRIGCDGGAKEMWDAAEHRFRTALRLFLEDTQHTHKEAS